MAFSRALYYPWIKIKDEGWLKNAMFYWDKIQTIVPESISQPYHSKTSREFHDEGLLLPLHVDSEMLDIRELTENVLKYFDTPEGNAVLMSEEIARGNIHLDKLPHEIRSSVEIHTDKLGYATENMICRIFKNGLKGDWISVDSRFADFYLTLLATHLSEEWGIGLLTGFTLQ